MTTIDVRAGGHDLSYPVHVETGVRTRVGKIADAVCPGRRWVVISDETVAGLYGDDALAAFGRVGLRAELLTFPAGERSKTRREWSRLSDELLGLGLGRDSGIVGLGGGVTGDLAGFVAATFMRGLPVIQVPTSLLAMIDASVGGKTGVNTRAGKNLVGAFHPPKTVLIDPEFTRTLPRTRRAEGLAEAVKHGLIRDAAYLESVQRDAILLLEGEPEATARTVATSVTIKADVVGADEHEGGLRKILNFGHTLGHGIEAASDYSLTHGEAVAIGMVAEARMGEALGVTESGTSDRIIEAARAVELPVAPPQTLDRARVTSAIRSDKKGVAEAPHWVPLARVGTAGAPDGGFTLPLSDAEAERALFGGGGAG